MKIIIKTLLLFAALCLAAFLLTTQLYLYALFPLVAAIWIVIHLCKTTIRLQNEVALFAETICYHDFSGRFNEHNVPVEIGEMRFHFNKIISAIKQLSREKEVHYQYLQKVLEMVDTGILAYHLQSGEVLWMNNAIKEMIHIPYLKTITSLQKRNRTFFDDLELIKEGTPSVLNLSKEGSVSKLLVSKSLFIVDHQPYQLIALQNVSDALHENELMAWQKVLRIITHEIINSVAPISSLADTLHQRMEEQTIPRFMDQEVLDDLRTGIETIGRRSKGLMRFAQTYRNLNKMEKPVIETVSIASLFEHIRQLLAPTLAQKEIQFHIQQPDPTLTLLADPNLLEQVLVNLVVNAMEAVKEKEEKWIKLSAYRTVNQKFKIQVSDNGYGIAPEMMENIFTPFFSGRPGGNGIGLTLCRQIMLMHNGAIYVNSKVGRGAVFTIVF